MKQKKDALRNISRVNNPSYAVIDTLVFNDNMDGEVLDNKIIEGKEKFDFYKNYIDPTAKDQIVELNDKNTKTEIKYLGELKDLDSKNSYHVISKFTIFGIGEMLSPRGQSEVAFINKRDNQTLVYDLGMPDNLPRSIEENVLVFDINAKKVGVLISGGLSPLLCIPEIGCN
jgi:hypothetical protein